MTQVLVQYLQSVTVGFVSLQAIINKLWFGYDLEHAISAPVMHTKGDKILFEKHLGEVSSLAWIFLSSPLVEKEIASVTLLNNLYFI